MDRPSETGPSSLRMVGGCSPPTPLVDNRQTLRSASSHLEIYVLARRYTSPQPSRPQAILGLDAASPRCRPPNPATPPPTKERSAFDAHRQLPLSPRPKRKKLSRRRPRTNARPSHLRRPAPLKRISLPRGVWIIGTPAGIPLAPSALGVRISHPRIPPPRRPLRRIGHTIVSVTCGSSGSLVAHAAYSTTAPHPALASRVPPPAPPSPRMSHPTASPRRAGVLEASPPAY
ncbi:hypothetical protein DFH09DRAFT_1369591 [Mycena vulgaris]|nr:hypothetical protein DFH09DRAFT_1369591 [Mycena vulgaris]